MGKIKSSSSHEMTEVRDLEACLEINVSYSCFFCHSLYINIYGAFVAHTLSCTQKEYRPLNNIINNSTLNDERKKYDHIKLF